MSQIQHHKRQTTPGVNLPPGIRPNQEMGQNFLVDKGVLERELAFSDLGREEIVLEIGPGTGELTRRLASRARQVHCIELDPQFGPILADLQSRYDNINLVWGDATQVAFPPCDKVVSNLPYRVSLPLIFKIIESNITHAVLVIQYDLARRLCAEPGMAGYSWLSVTAQRLATCELLEKVEKESFFPVPRVDSALVRLHRISPRFAIASRQHFRNFLDHAFLDRKRTVQTFLEVVVPRQEDRKAWGQLSPRLKRKVIEQLKPEEFGTIFRILDSHGTRLTAVGKVSKRQSGRSSVSKLEKKPPRQATSGRYARRK